MERIIEIDFQRCYKAVLKQAMSLLMAAVFGLVAGFGISLACFEQEDEYAVYSEVSCISASDLSVVPFYAEVVKTANVARRAAAMLNDTYSVSEIINLIQANYRENVTSGVPVIEIGAICQDPEKTVAIVDAVTESFIVELQTLTENETVRRLGESSHVELLYNASRTRLLVTLATALAFVLLLAAIIVLREILALRLTTVKDGLLNGQLKLIGVIPRYRK
ncbi:MAG: hypothetical protein IJO21_06440 [Oscillospiraceae bacterium]|nr:hypothetical protein [Oscillospiraceae bacterium]MBQ7130659.1 hypothetical protein [Oscillospiraceae bacterium]